MTKYTSVARDLIDKAPASIAQAELPGLPPKRIRHGGKRLRIARAEDLITIRQCEVELRSICQRLKQARAIKAVAKVRLAVGSVGGAGRHAYRALSPQEMERFNTWCRTSQLPAPEVEAPGPQIDEEKLA